MGRDRLAGLPCESSFFILDNGANIPERYRGFMTRGNRELNPFTPESDQSQISPPAPPEI